MSSEPVGFISPMASLDRLPELELKQPEASSAFQTWLEREMSELNTQLIDSDKALRKLAIGETNNIHQVMMTLEKAKLSFQLMMQVRNKALEAYQEVMRMQL